MIFTCSCGHVFNRKANITKFPKSKFDMRKVYSAVCPECLCEVILHKKIKVGKPIGNRKI